MSERLQKVLAQTGMGSRRQIEQWIKQGEIKVNGQIATLGTRVDGTDKISVRGRAVQAHERKPKLKVIIFNKKDGQICSRKDTEGRESVYDQLPKIQGGRWISVGRLDLNTSGLLMFTNDGELAHRLMHPSNQLEREYACRILGPVPRAMFERLHQGVLLEDGLANFSYIRDAGGQGANHWYHVVIKEGRQREVRRLWESQGVTVSRLIRVRFASVALPPRLAQGKWQFLTKSEIQELCGLVGYRPQQPIYEVKRAGGQRKKHRMQSRNRSRTKKA